VETRRLFFFIPRLELPYCFLHLPANTNWTEGFRAIFAMSGSAEADSKVKGPGIPGAGRRRSAIPRLAVRPSVGLRCILRRRVRDQRLAAWYRDRIEKPLTPRHRFKRASKRAGDPDRRSSRQSLGPTPERPRHRCRSGFEFRRRYILRRPPTNAQAY